MEKKRIQYWDLAELIDDYIDQVGITKVCSDVLTLLAHRLNDKLRVIGPALKKDDESHLSQTPSDGHSR